MVMFTDRVDAGRRLAQDLDSLRGTDVVVLGLPRGGVPVAAEVARALDAPLDVIVVRKLGVPFQPELAMGAVGEAGVRVVDAEIFRRAGVTDAELRSVERREREEVDARVARLRRGRHRVDLKGRTAVIVDDGLATGSTARAACRVARQLGAARVVVAVPVAPADTVRSMTDADTVVCVAVPERFGAVGAYYRDFTPTSEDEVVALLDAAARRRRDSGVRVAGDCEFDADVEIPIESLVLEGHLHLPDSPSGVVVFAHGSGSSRHSPRNRFVADVLHQAGFGTLLMDLLTPDEEHTRANVFDIELLAGRLGAATRWLGRQPEVAGLSMGYFGASTGAGAALWAAAEPDSDVAAVVSRGGRPDLAGPRLGLVRAPTLLIVGGADTAVLELNREALQRLHCPGQLAVIPGATHLFEEPGTLAEAAKVAGDWFARYLRGAGDATVRRPT
jgi:putative phosphoribosyl transferase